MRMIEPPMRMSGAADWTANSTPFRLVPIILSNCCSMIFPSGAATTALASTTSRRPCHALTSLSGASIAAGLPASARTPEALGPIFATASSILPRSRPVTTTVAPSATNSLAIAKPIPVVPPVITATLPQVKSSSLPPSRGSRVNPPAAHRFRGAMPARWDG